MLGMTKNMITILTTFNFGFIVLGLVLYVIPIFQMDNPTTLTAVQLCSGTVNSVSKLISFYLHFFISFISKYIKVKSIFN